MNGTPSDIQVRTRGGERTHAVIRSHPLMVIGGLGLVVAGLAGMPSTAYAGFINCAGSGGYSYELNSNAGFGDSFGYVLNENPVFVFSGTGNVAGSCNVGNSGSLAVQTTSSAILTDNGPQTFQFNGSGSAAYSASGTQLGPLHAQVSNGGSTSPFQYFYTQGGEAAAVINPLWGGGSSVADAEWQDTITFQDPLLAPGSPIQLNYTASLDASLTGIGNCNGAPWALTELALEQGPSTVLVGSVTKDPYGCFPQSDGPANAGSGQATVYVGQTYTIFGSLDILAVTSDGEAPQSLDYTPGSEASVDASNTANFYLQLLTPGAYYVDSEGVTDALPSSPPTGGSGGTSVPEPSTLALLGGALLGLGLTHRRRWTAARR